MEREKAKNILIFADGTGNEGGIMPDESGTNAYKLFRATRTGPESPIDPSKEICCYINGIGTPQPGKQLEMSDHLNQVFGGGLTKRIIDGYSAIASACQPGDRIYLFGFSRGAYTSRCIAHVVELFGIPRCSPGGSKKLDQSPTSIRKICKEAAHIL